MLFVAATPSAVSRVFGCYPLGDSSGRPDSNQLLGNTYAVLQPLSYDPLVILTLREGAKSGQSRDAVGMKFESRICIFSCPHSFIFLQGNFDAVR